MHNEDRFFFVNGMLIAPLVTAGVSDGAAQEFRMPIGPQALEDEEEPMPSCPATLKDLDTPDQIVLDQHSLTPSPSQLWLQSMRRISER